MNIEQIVARLAAFGKLGGFHFNDSKYGDDDLDSGSINPHQLFLSSTSWLRPKRAPAERFRSGLHDRSVAQCYRPYREPAVVAPGPSPAAYARALIVDREALAAQQNANDVMMAFPTLRRPTRPMSRPILAMARYELGGAIDPVAAFRRVALARAQGARNGAPPPRQRVSSSAV